MQDDIMNQHNVNRAQPLYYKGSLQNSQQDGNIQLNLQNKGQKKTNQFNQPNTGNCQDNRQLGVWFVKGTQYQPNESNIQNIQLNQAQQQTQVNKHAYNINYNENQNKAKIQQNKQAQGQFKDSLQANQQNLEFQDGVSVIQQPCLSHRAQRLAGGDSSATTDMNHRNPQQSAPFYKLLSNNVQLVQNKNLQFVFQTNTGNSSDLQTKLINDQSRVNKKGKKKKQTSLESSIEGQSKQQKITLSQLSTDALAHQAQNIRGFFKLAAGGSQNTANQPQKIKNIYGQKDTHQEHKIGDNQDIRQIKGTVSFGGNSGTIYTSQLFVNQKNLRESGIKNLPFSENYSNETKDAQQLSSLQLQNYTASIETQLLQGKSQSQTTGKVPSHRQPSLSNNISKQNTTVMVQPRPIQSQSNCQQSFNFQASHIPAVTQMLTQNNSSNTAKIMKMAGNNGNTMISIVRNSPVKQKDSQNFTGVRSVEDYQGGHSSQTSSAATKQCVKIHSNKEKNNLNQFGCLIQNFDGQNKNLEKQLPSQNKQIYYTALNVQGNEAYVSNEVKKQQAQKNRYPGQSKGKHIFVNQVREIQKISNQKLATGQSAAQKTLKQKQIDVHQQAKHIGGVSAKFSNTQQFQFGIRSQAEAEALFINSKVTQPKCQQNKQFEIPQTSKPGEKRDLQSTMQQQEKQSTAQRQNIKAKQFDDQQLNSSGYANLGVAVAQVPFTHVQNVTGSFIGPNIELSPGFVGVPAASVGNHMFAPVHGSSSATNKVRKAFDFEVEHQPKVKRERKVGFSTAQTNIAATGKTVSTGKKTGVIQSHMVNATQIMSANPGSKKINLQKPAKIKTQMNMTGPLPKHLLGPGTVTNLSQGKSKHSQYFDHTSETVGPLHFHQPYPQLMASPPQQHYQPVISQGVSGLPLIQASSPMHQVLQHQFQVQLNPIGATLGESAVSGPHTQHQITTQGGNTVININIDSNGWQHPRNGVSESNYQPQQAEPVDSVNPFIATQNQMVIHAAHGSQQTTLHRNPDHQVHYLNPDICVAGRNKGFNFQDASDFQIQNSVKRQSSSKMRGNDSVSSNKSRRNAQGSNHNRRSSSGSHIQKQISQMQKIHNFSYNANPLISSQLLFGKQISAIQSSHVPTSNTQIISQNIAKINEKLLLQQLQQANLSGIAQNELKNNHQPQKFQLKINQASDCLENQINLTHNHQTYRPNKTAKISLVKSQSVNKSNVEAVNSSQNQSNGIKTQIIKSSDLAFYQKQQLNQTQKMVAISQMQPVSHVDFDGQQIPSYALVQQHQTSLADGTNQSWLQKPSQNQFKATPGQLKATNGLNLNLQQKLTLKKLTTTNAQRTTQETSSMVGSARDRKQLVLIGSVDSTKIKQSDNNTYQLRSIQETQMMRDQAYDQHLREMENQIEQNQIRLRNELQMMQKLQSSGMQLQFGNSIDQNNEKIEDMGMDVDMEDIVIENLGNKDTVAGFSTNEPFSNGHQKYRLSQQPLFAPLQMHQPQKTLFNATQQYKSNYAPKSQGRQQAPEPQQLNLQRQQSFEDASRQHYDGQSVQQNSQLRGTCQKRGQFNKLTANQGQSKTSNLRGNQSSAASAKGRSSKSKANRISNSKVNIVDINTDIDGMMGEQILIDSSLGLAAAINSFGTKKSVTTKNSNFNNKLKTQNVQSLLREAKREMVLESNELEQIQVGGDDLTTNNSKSKGYNILTSQNLAPSVQTGKFATQQQKLNIQYGISPKNRKIGCFDNSNILLSEDYCSNLHKITQSTNLQAFENVGAFSKLQSAAVQANSTSHQGYAAQGLGTFGLGQINMKKKIFKSSAQVGGQNGHFAYQSNQAQLNQMQSEMIQQMQQQNIQNKCYEGEQLDHQQTYNFDAPQSQQQHLNQLHEGVECSYQVQAVKRIQPQAVSKQNLGSAVASNIWQQSQEQNNMPQHNQLISFDQILKNEWFPQSCTLPSQASESKIMLNNQRSSNMPPNSSTIVKNSDENFLANSIASIQVDNEDGSLLYHKSCGNDNQQKIGGIIEGNYTLLDKNNEDHKIELPLSGAKVLKHFLKRSELTEYEKSEILDYKMCYFLGLKADKVKGSKHNQYNYGFDDERGDYNVVLLDQIAYRFEVIDFLGKGSFGQALKCMDHKTGEIVAIKIIRNKKKFQHQAGVELKILLHLKENDPEDTNNIIRIKDYCMFRKHLVISFELFSINLYEFIKNNNFEGVSLSLIRRFAIQILQALKYLREESLIHCDLKPENILLKSPDKSGIKVIDFGSSCFSNQRIYTYIQSRFYRAPEIILGIPYTSAIDMWSFGCILTELFTGVPLFPGESEQEQLSLIMEVIGLPSKEILDQAGRQSVFFDEATGEPYLSRDSQNNLRIPSSKPLDEILMCQSESFQDFIAKCLDWDPEARITPFNALMHEWIIEGLPPQVLIHHKKMLGIYESETEEDQITSNYQSKTGQNPNEDNTYRQGQDQDHSKDGFQTQNDSDKDYQLEEYQNSNNASKNHDFLELQPKIFQNQTGQYNQKNEQNGTEIQNMSEEMRINKIIKQNIKQKNEITLKNQQQLNKQIDFYGQVSKSTERQDYSEKYESILSQGANKNLKINQSKLNKQMDVVSDKNVEIITMTKIKVNNKNQEKKSREGAKQENFNKTGQLIFKEIKSQQNENQQATKITYNVVDQQPRGPQRYGQLLKCNKSDFQEDQQDEIMTDLHEITAGIGNGDINQALMSKGIRGIIDFSIQNKINNKQKQNQLIIQDSNEKSKTTVNISDILKQVNKKSKSTKNHNINLERNYVQYNQLQES